MKIKHNEKKRKKIAPDFYAACLRRGAIWVELYIKMFYGSLITPNKLFILLHKMLPYLSTEIWISVPAAQF